MLFAEAGDRVIAVDVDQRKVEAIACSHWHIEDVSSSRLTAVRGQISASTRFALLAKADAIVICVPTRSPPTVNPILGRCCVCCPGR